MAFTEQERHELLKAARALRTTKRNQVFGKWEDVNYFPVQGNGCAMRVIAAEVYGVTNLGVPANPPAAYQAVYYQEKSTKPQCPGCYGELRFVGDLVIHLNDQHRMSFTGIATVLEWLAQRAGTTVIDIPKAEEEQHEECVAVGVD